MSFCQRRWLLLLILIILVLATFYPVAHFRFIDWDDWLALGENPDFSPVAWHKIAGYWLHGKLELYAPLSYTLWAVIAWTEQTFTHQIPLLPGPFHLANLTLHLTASLIVFLLLYRLIPRLLPAFAGAMVFALHPLQIEPIAWVASFNTLLSVLLTIVALWAYVQYAQCSFQDRRDEEAPAQPRDGNISASKVPWFFISCLALLLALCAKPMAIPAPAIALIIDAWILRRPVRRWAGPILVWVLLVFPFVIIGRLVQMPYQATQTSIWLRPFIVADSFAFYLLKLFWPLHQTLDYQRSPIHLLHSQQIWLTWLIPATIIFLGWAKGRIKSLNHRSIESLEMQNNDLMIQCSDDSISPIHHSAFHWLLVGLAIMFAATLPTSGIVGFAFQRYSTVADRYMYLGMLGIAVAVAGISTSLPRRFLVVCIIIFGTLFVLRDRVRLSDWHDTLSITANALQVNDDCAVDHRVRAFALSRLGRHDEAIAQYELAVHYDPTDADTYYDYANLLYRDGHTKEALAMYAKAIALRPLRAEFHHNYAVALMGTGQKSQAGVEFRTATQLDPTSDQARNDYSRWLQLQK